MMLKVFQDKFQRWRYIEFSKLDQPIEKAFKEIFIAKDIYIGTLSNYINQYLVKLIINEPLLA